jgi:hypothetical protein
MTAAIVALGCINAGADDGALGGLSIGSSTIRITVPERIIPRAIDLSGKKFDFSYPLACEFMSRDVTLLVAEVHGARALPLSSACASGAFQFSGGTTAARNAAVLYPSSAY